MSRILQEVPEKHRCYDELNIGTRHMGPGTVVECSCGARYRLEKGNILTGVWDDLCGRGHTTASRGLWDRWVRI